MLIHLDLANSNKTVAIDARFKDLAKYRWFLHGGSVVAIVNGRRLLLQDVLVRRTQALSAAASRLDNSLMLQEVKTNGQTDSNA